MNNRIKARNRRKQTIRKKISGNIEKPRMCINKSNKNIYVQIINDVEGKTLCGLSTMSSIIKEKKDAKTRKNLIFAELIGENIAKIAVEKGIKKVVFDRSGYKYHGVIKAIADSARKNGLEF